MVFWECHELRAWEAKPEGLTNTLSNKHFLTKIKLATENASADPSLKSLREIRRGWTDIARSYAKCDLSLETDKLVALSGIASAVQRFTGYPYLAGLWESGSLYYMFWYSKARFSDDGKVPGKRPPKYCAPSWSWASIEDDIYHNEE